MLLVEVRRGEKSKRGGSPPGGSPHTVADWLELYEEGGVEKIQGIDDPGPAPGQQSIPSSVVEVLKELSFPRVDGHLEKAYIP